MNATEQYTEPLQGNSFSEDRLLIGVGVGVGLLFSLALLAIIATLACRGQHIRRRRRSRRLASTVSMAYSDFETYKVARTHGSSTPSTNLSTITSSSLSQIYATPFKIRTADKSTQGAPINQNFISNTSGMEGHRHESSEADKTTTLVFGGWRFREPTGQSGTNATHSEERRKKPTAAVAGESRHCDVSHGRDDKPDASPTVFSTRILSPAYTGKPKRDDQTRLSHDM